jgi:hypothetical protein
MYRKKGKIFLVVCRTSDREGEAPAAPGYLGDDINI